MKMDIPRIAESEWRVMKILWQKAPLTANEIVDILVESTSWKPKTIKTLLNRLVNKNALGFEKRGRTYHYYPVVSEADCAHIERQTFLNKVYAGSLQPMLAAFVEDKKLSDEEIEELKRILDRQKGETS